jgi:hypothetical protein
MGGTLVVAGFLKLTDPPPKDGQSSSGAISSKGRENRHQMCIYCLMDEIAGATVQLRASGYNNSQV